jgi:hypothetical protein
MKYLLCAFVTAACLFPTGAMAQCRGTAGMTSCDFPQGPTERAPSTDPRPAGQDTGGPGAVAPPMPRGTLPATPPRPKRS